MWLSWTKTEKNDEKLHLWQKRPQLMICSSIFLNSSKPTITILSWLSGRKTSLTVLWPTSHSIMLSVFFTFQKTTHASHNISTQTRYLFTSPSSTATQMSKLMERKARRTAPPSSKSTYCVIRWQYPRLSFCSPWTEPHFCLLQRTTCNCGQNPRIHRWLCWTKQV